MDIDALTNVMGTEDGRHVIADILDLCGTSSHYTTGNDRKDAFFNGRRSVGDELRNWVRSIKAKTPSEDGLALEYTMLREHIRRMEE